MKFHKPPSLKTEDELEQELAVGSIIYYSPYCKNTHPMRGFKET
jgi:hypothetical protein